MKLNNLIEYLLTEKIRSKTFNMRTFKSLNSIRKIWDYAENNLEKIGEGSSRAVYLVSSKYVLKVAYPEYLRLGIAQNEAEFNTYENSERSPLLPKIYEHDVKFYWLLSELVNPVKDWKEFKRITGSRNPSAAIIENSSSPFAIEFAKLLRSNSLSLEDAVNYHQWGKTTDGRMVLLDTGGTEHIIKNMYESVEPEKEVSFETATDAFFYDNLDENVLDVISNNAIQVHKKLLRHNEFSIRDCDMAARAWHKVLKKAGIQSRVRSGYYIEDPKTLKAVKSGELSPPGVSDHVWLTIGGNIFDPTAGQFKGPIKLSHYIYDDEELNESVHPNASQLEFLHGGCLDYAQAFQDIYGGELYVIIVGNSKHHVVVKKDNTYFDILGKQTKEQLLSRWSSMYGKKAAIKKATKKDLREYEQDEDRYDDAKQTLQGLYESVQHDINADEAYLLNTDPMELDEDEYLNKYENILIKKFPGPVIELDNAINPQDKIRIQYVIIPAENKTDLKFWLQSKLEMEGEPEDDELIEQIGEDGHIYCPIVLDTRNDYTIEGRHRLTAALKYNLDCPALLVLDDEED